MCVFLSFFVCFFVLQAVGVLIAKMGHGNVERATLDKVGQMVRSLEVSGRFSPWLAYCNAVASAGAVYRLANQAVMYLHTRGFESHGGQQCRT